MGTFLLPLGVGTELSVARRGTSRGDAQVLHAQKEFKKAAETSQKSTKRGKRKAKLPFQILLGEAPQIRVRNLSDRQMQQLGELVVANERLAGRHGSEARRTVEFLKRNRERWELIYNILVKDHATATLADLEKAHLQVAEAMSEESRDTKSVAELKEQLVNLQQQVSAAHQKLHYTQELVQLNKDRIQQLTSQTQAAQRLDESAAVRPDSEGQQSAVLSTAGLEQLSVPRIVPVEEPATNRAWLPVAFSETVKKEMTKIEHAGQPWILFRDNNGQLGCIEDCCAHRACPLSLGQMNDGQPTCAYHGWRYDRQGECTEMPSTRFRCGVRVNSMSVREVDGMIWIADPTLARLTPGPVNHATIPPGFSVVTRTQADVMTDASILEASLLAEGSLVIGSSNDVSKSTQGTSASYRIRPGWIYCATGHELLEIHTISAAQPGQCRWLYQVCTSKAWGNQALVRQLRQREAEQIMQSFSTRLTEGLVSTHADDGVDA